MLMDELNIEKNARILIVAPHQDDESIGCGGIMLRYGCQTDIVFVTDGCKGHSNNISDLECSKIRREEAENAAQIAGINCIMFMEIPDREVGANYKRLKTIDVSPYQYIFIPNRNELHVDHYYTNAFLQRIIHKKNRKSEVYEYEVWSPLSAPTSYCDISELIDLKQQLVCCFKSQLHEFDYSSISYGLAKYRGAMVGVSFAEAYERLSFGNTIRKVYRKMPWWIKNTIRRIR